MKVKSLEIKSKFSALLLAVRLPTLFAGIAPIVLGNIIAYRYQKDLFKDLSYELFVIAFFTFIGVMLLQIGANLVNDLKDAENGIDNNSRVGPTRVVQNNLLSPEFVKNSYRFCFFIAFVIAICFVERGGVITIVLSMLGIIVAYLYTGGPYPLSYFALGELLALIFFGPLTVGGTVYIQNLVWSKMAFVLGVGPGFVAAAIMAINNYRDIESDIKTGKKTLASILPRKFARMLPLMFLLLSLFILLFYSLLYCTIAVTILSVSLCFLYILFLINPLIKLDSKPIRLNSALKHTTIYAFFYSVIFSMVILVGNSSF